MYTIAVLALNSCFYSSVIGVYDIFTVANLKWCKLTGGDEPFCEVSVVQPDDGPVLSFTGMRINQGKSMSVSGQYDIVVVPAMFGGIDEVLERSQIISWITNQHDRGSCICTVCAGAFLAAEAGLLDGRRATTHWALVEDFKRRFPLVDLHHERMIVDEGDVISAGGVTAYQDLCLYLVSRFGTHELAATLSQSLLIDGSREVQLPYSANIFIKNHGDEAILKCQRWLEKNCTQETRLRDAANAAGLGMRTFSRRFRRATGESLSVYVQMLRIEMARKLLTNTQEGFEEITFNVGYEDPSSFRRLFKKHTGLSPSEYRRRFSVLS